MLLINFITGKRAMSDAIDNANFNSIYMEFKNKFIDLANNKNGVGNYVKLFDFYFVEKIDVITTDVVVLINEMDLKCNLDYRSISSNMELACSMLDEMNRYKDLTVMEVKNVKEAKELYARNKVEMTAKIAQLITGITSCINNIKMDCFFSGVSFLGKKASEYNDLLEVIESIEEAEKSFDEKASEAEALLIKMKLVEKAILREGLVGSYRRSERKLFWRILGLDILNYLSLFLIFVVTLVLFIDFNAFDVSKFELLKLMKLKEISIYERFIVIIPLVCISWFASKRSQFLYQIREEYSYKYATALAYEGYKDEIDTHSDTDNKMRDKLMGITIDNLGRSPLAQFDKNSDHAPYTQFIREFRKK